MNDIDQLVEMVLSSAKYRRVSPALVRRIGARELAARRNLKEAVKATRNKLHQVGGAYFSSPVDYERALARLRETAVSDPAFLATCRDLMRLHASTRERLPILDEFYATTLAALPPITTVLDVACGFNPLARPWMPFPAQVEYLACDMYGDLVEFIGQFMEIAHVRGIAEMRDVISDPPTHPVDLALLLKLLPVLAQVEKTAVPRLLDALQARYLLISFPAHSLGGRGKGMAQNYEAQFHAWAEGRAWRVQRFQFPAELAFLVQCER